MRWPNFVRLTLSADDVAAERKEHQDRLARDRALAANGGGWSRF